MSMDRRRSFSDQHEFLQLGWDSTSIGYLKSCPRYYQYSMIYNWQERRAINLEFGIMYHMCMEQWDRLKARGVPKEDAVVELARYCLLVSTQYWLKGEIVSDYQDDFIPKEYDHYEFWTTDNTGKNRWTLFRSVIWYCDFYWNDPYQPILDKDGIPAVELSFKVYSGIDSGITQAEEYFICGHLDKVIEGPGKDIWLCDHKTTGTTIEGHFFDRFSPDNQMSTYAFGGAILLPDVPIRGLLIDGVQVAVGFSRFQRGFALRNPAQLEEWHKGIQILLQQNETYVEANFWPMNEKSCFLCPFKGICSKHPDVRQQHLETQFEIRREPWDPMKPR